MQYLSSKLQHPTRALSLPFLLFALFSAALLLPVSSYAVEGQQSEEQSELKFPGEDSDNKLVYHFNKSDSSYQLAVLNTIRNMLRKYGDDIKIVVSVMGSGIHILLKEPGIPVIPAVRDQVASLAFYGVEFHACGNTLTTLHKDEKDVLEFASVVDAGVADLMELQQQGYAYISW